MGYGVVMNSGGNNYSFVTQTEQDVRDLVANSYQVTEVRVFDENGDVTRELTEQEINTLLGLDD